MNRPLYPYYAYNMLEQILRHFAHLETPLALSILDCGAGGDVPPLGLFYENGFVCHGIDISQDQIDLALLFSKKHKMSFDIRRGNMKSLSYADNHFDVVYEYHSMGHLRKPDIEVTLREMYRVLKPGGLCFVGFMLEDTFPIIGKNIGNNEYSLIEAGDSVIHSVYDKSEALEILRPWYLLKAEVLRTEHTFWNQTVSDEVWMSFYDEGHSDLSPNEWLVQKSALSSQGNYSHLYCVLKK